MVQISLNKTIFLIQLFSVLPFFNQNLIVVFTLMPLDEFASNLFNQLEFFVKSDQDKNAIFPRRKTLSSNSKLPDVFH